MFSDTIIVQSAVSAFNNSALVAPAFFWWGVLTLPLFVLVYYCGGAFLERIGWNSHNIDTRTSLWTVLLTLCWVVLFGGNYGVLRDSSTILPFAIAALVLLQQYLLPLIGRSCICRAFVMRPHCKNLA